jgi:acyl carrier protein
MLSFSEIQERVVKILAVISGIPGEEIGVDSTFEDLDLDSLARIEMLVELEREFEIETPEDQDDEEILKQIQSIEDAAKLVEKTLSARDAN